MSSRLSRIGEWFYLDLPARQQQLCAEIDAQKKEIIRKRNNIACRAQYQKRKRAPSAAVILRRERYAAWKANAKAKREAKAERKRLREAARKRKFRDPVKDSARIYQRGFEDGVRSITESGLWFKRQ